MKVLAAASEIFPLVKTGGLADVVGALPGALKSHGIEMRCLLPGYPAVMAALHDGKAVHGFDSLFGGPAHIIAGKAGELEILALDAPHLYLRAGNPYVGPGGIDWPDNWQRFGALGFVAGEIGGGKVKAFVPDLVHGHDWQAGLAPAYLHFLTRKVPSVFTIHNLAFQGWFPSAIFPELGLPPAAYGIAGVEYYGGIGYLKSGLHYADAITTVSPSYADEICTPQGGMGLDGLLRSRRDDLIGIVNGIDTDVWNPATDRYLVKQYDAASVAERAANKRAVEKRFDLGADEGPLLCVVSRLTWQKGMDILVDRIDELVQAGMRLALLGSGDAAIESALMLAAERHSGRIGTIIGYDEALSHLLQGGADAILIPSRFEPCGLTQLYGLRYGCVPVITHAGGLADTIVDANEAALDSGAATGFHFASADGAHLLNALRRVARVYKEPQLWRRMQQRGMGSDVSWNRSAARYASLYKHAIARKKS